MQKHFYFENDFKYDLQVFRHGPRTPADTYPKDPHVNESFYPYGWGHLTNDGKKYMFESGEWLRQRYGQFLGELYVPDVILLTINNLDNLKSISVLTHGKFICRLFGLKQLV